MPQTNKTTRSAKVVQRAKSSKAAIAKKRATVATSRGGRTLGGFADFIRTQGVVGLAVGLAIGMQAGATVKSIVEGFINPSVAFIVGSQDGLLNEKWFLVGKDTPDINYWLTFGDRELIFAWGSVFSSLITLVAVAAVIYFVVKGFKLDKLDKKKE